MANWENMLTALGDKGLLDEALMRATMMAGPHPSEGSVLACAVGVLYEKLKAVETKLTAVDNHVSDAEYDGDTNFSDIKELITRVDELEDRIGEQERK